MSAYIVRMIDGRELVGIFVAPNVEAVAELVDEVVPPPDCEYRRLPALGGVTWTGQAPIIPYKMDENGNTAEGVDFEHSEGLDFTEGWFAVLHDDDPDRGWKRQWGDKWLSKQEIDAARAAVKDARGVMHLDPSNPAEMMQPDAGRRTGYPIGDNDNDKDGTPDDTEGK